MSFGFYFIEDQVYFYTAQNRANIARTQCPQKKNRTFSYEEFTAELYERYRKENEMADSVTKARFNQEFVPYVQPKVDVKTKKIVDGEVLLRWFDEDGKEIALSEFLPVLNKFADIYLVDFNIFEQVCKFMHHCNKEGKKMVPLSFNITNTSFFDNDFINDYTTMLEKYKLSESMIEFEFMENIQFGNYEKVKQIISTFRKAGFLCALDDFGSGYSSFNILLNSQIDILKLDRVFFNKELNEENRTAIQSIINICKKLHVKVIAEGIEDQKYVNYLEQAGCDIIQGFYFYKPMSLDAFQQLIQQES
ncbi:MAG: EAL domain-containing protein [Bacilli bacterium]|nr:EAL domain-containing protein [Bacilli bacterium]